MHRNISFEYLYRDAANYKNWGEVILQGSPNVDIDEVSRQLRAALIDGINFVAEQVKVPTLYFSKRDEAIDHGWHEFFQISWTEQPATDQRTIEHLIVQMGTSHSKFAWTGAV